jgi:hypothetical protein
MLFRLDAIGFQFIVNTSGSTLNSQNRRVVRSHTTRAHGKRRKTVQLRSWIDSDHNDNTTKKSDPRSISVPGPRQIGGEFSALQLPLGIEPDMIQDLVQRKYSGGSFCVSVPLADEDPPLFISYQLPP